MAQESNGSQDKKDKIYEENKSLDLKSLLDKKILLVKDLEKNIKQVSDLDLKKAVDFMMQLDKVVKQLSSIDVSRKGERAKLAKSLEKVSELVSNMSVLDQIVSEKAKVSKALEKISEVSSSIPVIEKILSEKDF